MPTKSSFQGLPIVIEYKKGEWKPNSKYPDEKYMGWEMLADYGFIDGAASNDEEDLDIFIGTNPESTLAFYMPLMTEDKEDGNASFDEYKVLLGFNSLKEAQEFAYSQYYGKAGELIQTSVDDIKQVAELSIRKQQLNEAWAQKSETTEPELTVDVGQEINQYGQTGDRLELVVEY